MPGCGATSNRPWMPGGLFYSRLHLESSAGRQSRNQVWIVKDCWYVFPSVFWAFVLSSGPTGDYMNIPVCSYNLLMWSPRSGPCVFRLEDDLSFIRRLTRAINLPKTDSNGNVGHIPMWGLILSWVLSAEVLELWNVFVLDDKPSLLGHDGVGWRLVDWFSRRIHYRCLPGSPFVFSSNAQ